MNALSFFLVLFFFLCANAQARAVAGQTCLEAQSSVISHRRYEQSTTQGPREVYPVIPVNEDPSCKSEERVLNLIERTADMSECLLGFQCAAL